MAPVDPTKKNDGEEKDGCTSNYCVEGNAARPKRRPVEDASGDLTEASGAGSVSTSSSSLGSITIKPDSTTNLKSIYQSPLQHLNCSFGVVTPASKEESGLMGGSVPLYKSLQTTVREELARNGANVLVAFLVRYPSCQSCREHALQLAEYAATDRRLALMGIVKGGTTSSSTSNTNKMMPSIKAPGSSQNANHQPLSPALEKSLLEFYQSYFRSNPLFRDSSQKQQSLFQALVGGRKLGILKTLWNLIHAQRRYKQKQIRAGPLIAEAEKMVQGGVLIFDRQGVLRFLVPEDTYGVELDMGLIEAAIQTARSIKSKRSSMSSSLKSTASSSSATAATK